MSHLISVLLGHPPYQIKVTPDMREDVNWWLQFLPQFNGKQPVWLVDTEVDAVFATDATLMRIGGVAGQQYFTIPLSQKLLGKTTNIFQ